MLPSLGSGLPLLGALLEATSSVSSEKNRYEEILNEKGHSADLGIFGSASSLRTWSPLTQRFSTRRPVVRVSRNDPWRAAQGSSIQDSSIFAGSGFAGISGGMGSGRSGGSGDAKV